VTAAVSFEDVAPRVQADEAKAFFNTWFEGRDGVAVLTRMEPEVKGASTKRWPNSRAVPADQVSEMISDDLLAEIVLDESGNWNSYFSCSTHVTDPTHGGKRRGGKNTVSAVHGLWLDLDVKDGAFESASDCDSLIRGMGLRPTAVVDSGSGGQHAYWKLDRPLPKDKGEKLCTAWVARAREISGIHIDRLVTCDRVMRIPGTIRWPKTLGETPRLVHLRHNESGIKHSVEAVWGLAGHAWDRQAESLKADREWGDEQKALGARELSRLLEAGGWAGLVGISGFEDSFNENMSWREILEPHGWTQLGEDSDGRQRWARPGRDSKSAHAGYPESPHVMNLFSDDPGTGLNDLLVAGTDLTKLRVHAKLAYGGDLARLIRDYFESE